MDDRQAMWLSMLQQVREGELDPAHAAARIEQSLAQPLGYALVDHDRTRRCGVPEAVYAAGKTPEQTAEIAQAIAERHGYCLITRMTPEHVEVLRRTAGDRTLDVAPRGRTVILGNPPVEASDVVVVPIVTAGSSDEIVAEEAMWTCRVLGQPVVRINDVGIAGVHRLGRHLETLREAKAIICIAGMEGALPSVLGGLVPGTVIGVPSSVGYGAALNGWTALLSMLTSCAAGVVVVNIDNGFGAAVAAARITRT
ncbi:MAG: nickel pincer cofactor biosynthesis protein LarB [Phycisphaeraceae bacterium]|nr:nickel pincer cofactor biosynthesis protein LarB [Phycisphaeraceae bacterium]